MKYCYFYLMLFLILGLVVSCSDSNDDSPCLPKIETPDDSLSGMLRVNASNASVVLGTKESSAKVGERPEMKVSLNYVFLFAKSEVTCGEFNALMKKSTGLVVSCSHDSLPVTNVTYYDAVLFANERSKAEKRDTVYTYSKVLLDDEKHCTNLEGLVFHTEMDGYRLPTEAEWMLVAKTVWTTAEGWTAENSDFKLHKVCSKADSSDDFCDIIGNAMEWVNDWYGNFRDTSLTNYVGAPDGGTLGQRIVKGGSYRNTAESIKIYNRGDVYTVTSSTRAEYVGFRLAFGAIPEATWMGNDGRASASRIVPVVSLSELHSITGSRRIKLAFRNATKNIAFIDYSNSILSVTEIVDSLDAYHPEISPDGKHVAFCTGLEGISGKSALYVRDLNAAGTNLVKLDVESAAIPRWRVLKNGDTVIVYVTDAGNNKEKSAFISASTWQVKFSNGKFGSPKKLFDGAYHGGISEDKALAVTGARLLRARVSGHDTVWYNSEQACNASLSGDSSKRTLFLDFGSKTGREFVDRKYGTHERLLIADSAGTLVQSVAAPAGFSFDHSEWVLGAKDLAVATLTNANGAHTKVVLVNLADSSVMDLAEGDELWHPSLWVNHNSFDNENIQLDMDSAGVYFVQGQDWPHEALGYKMNLLWKYANQVEVLCVGSSRTEDGIIATKIQSGFALNMGHPGNDLNASLYVAENYGVNHLKKLKTIVVSLDIDLWQSETSFSDLLFLNTPGYIYDKNHSFWKNDGLTDFSQIVEAVSPFSSAAIDVYGESRGWLKNESVEWGIPLVESDSNWSISQSQTLDWNLKRLESFVEEMNRLQINVVGVVFPQNPRYQETGSWGRYGPQRSAAVMYIDSVQALARRVPRFTLLDENRNGNHDYTDQMALNTDHLGIAGAERLTARLDSLLKKMD